jgi:RNA polymerase sigma-70 factor (ECF subfamily)
MTDPTTNEPEDRRAEFEREAIPLLKDAYNLALRLTRRAEDAREVVQETYLRAYRTFGNFRYGTNCRAWLFTILYSVFVNRYRKERREPKALSVEELEERFHRTLESKGAANLVTESAAPTWTDPDVERAVSDLPPKLRTTVLLVDVGELTYEEAATALGCPVGTVRSRLSRARKTLFVTLERYARRAGYLPGSSEKK